MYVYADAIVAWLHFVLIFSLLGSLVAELVRLRHPLDAATIQRLGRFDLVYGLSALFLLIIGASRAAHFAKGWQFYAHEPWFWVKLALFAAVGVISIVPTVQIQRWRKDLVQGRTPEVTPERVRRLRCFVHVELGLLPLIALAAAMMARGL